VPVYSSVCAGTHCVYSWKDGQAELTWVRGYLSRIERVTKGHSYHVESARNWEVEAVVRCFILNNYIVPVDSVSGKIDSICRSGN